MSDIPIDFTELTQLTQLGIPQSSLDFKSTTLESDHYICVRESGPLGNTVAIVDLKITTKLQERICQQIMLSCIQRNLSLV